MIFYCFPKKQQYCSLYTSSRFLKTRLFSNFALQASPKNSLLFRFRASFVGHILFSVFSKTNIDVPNSQSEYIGIRKTNKLVLIELQNFNPIAVWKLNGKKWTQEQFLGYQLLSELSYKEIFNQKDLIKKALKEHWASVKQSKQNIHGDFTHLNILYDQENNINFIDKIDIKNSVLYDFFYFYAYLKQSIYRDLSTSISEKKKIIALLEIIIRNVCVYSDKEQFKKDFDEINIDTEFGISLDAQETYLSEFFNLLNFESTKS